MIKSSGLIRCTCPRWLSSSRNGYLATPVPKAPGKSERCKVNEMDNGGKSFNCVLKRAGGNDYRRLGKYYNGYPADEADEPEQLRRGRRRCVPEGQGPRDDVGPYADADAKV